MSEEDGTISQLPIFAYYNKQRFTQMGAMDCAGWYGVAVPDTKNGQALYPTMGRAHIEFFNQNVLVFPSEASQLFKTVNYMYVIDSTNVIAVDQYYNQTVIGSVPLGSTCWFDFSPTGDVVQAILTTGTNLYLITESAAGVTMVLITDANRPPNPLYVAAFGGRFVVSNADSPSFYITVPGVLNPATCFTQTGGGALFGTASGVIGQMGVFQTQLYIFCSYTTDVWANIQSTLTVAGTTVTFPFKQSTSYSWDYGIADPFSLDIDFGKMAWLGQNKNGLISFLVSNGQQPEDISSQAINVILQNSKYDGGLSAFQVGPVDAFLYQYENTIFYRASAGEYVNYQQLDIHTTKPTTSPQPYSLEYNFSTKKWGRVIELNGQRNRINKHCYFNDKHIVTVQDDGALYEMAGNIYRNELRTPGTMPNDTDAFSKYPMRYELVTQQIFQPDYSEFITDYVEIDFVFGDRTFYQNTTAFGNTTFIITEDSPNPPLCNIYVITEDAAPDGTPVFVITEDGNTPSFDDNFYNNLFKPHIELYLSDDGGISWESRDIREFSRLGQYRWRMRWYECGTSRNRCYMVIAVSSAPIVILGGVQSTRRASGGAN